MIPDFSKPSHPLDTDQFPKISLKRHVHCPLHMEKEHPVGQNRSELIIITKLNVLKEIGAMLSQINHLFPNPVQTFLFSVRG